MSVRYAKAAVLLCPMILPNNPLPSTNLATCLQPGIDRLIENESYMAAFPLHDGEYAEEEVKSSAYPTTLGERHFLYERWAVFANWRSPQPFDRIRYAHRCLAVGWAGLHCDSPCGCCRPNSGTTLAKRSPSTTSFSVSTPSGWWCRPLSACWCSSSGLRSTTTRRTPPSFATATRPCVRCVTPATTGW